MSIFSRLNNSSINSLIKSAEYIKKVGFDWETPLGKIIRYGVPAGVGASAAYGAHEAGFDPVTSAAAGIGTGAVASPAEWSGILRKSKILEQMGGDRVSAISDLGLNSLLRKAKIIGPIAGVDYGTRIGKNLLDTTSNMAGITGSLNKTMPDMEQNVADNLSVLKNILQNKNPINMQYSLSPSSVLGLSAGIGGAGVGSILLLNHLLNKKNKGHHING